VPVDDELYEALVQLAPGMMFGSAADLRRTARGLYEVVIVPQAAKLDPENVASLVRPGGWAHFECSARRLPRLRAALRRSGFDQFRPLWHWPSVAGATRIVPLDDRQAMRRAIGTGGTTLARRTGRLGAGMVAHAGLFHLLCGEATLLARRRPESDAEAFERLPIFPQLSVVPAHHGLSGEASWLLLTPRFRASRHVILLAWRGDGSPTLVAKAARRAAGGAGLLREANALQLVAGTAAAHNGSAPRLVAIGQLDAHTVLVETGMTGRHLDRGEVRRDPQRWIAEASTWLLNLPASTQGDQSWRTSLDQFLGRVPPLSELGEIAGRTLALLEPQVSTALPRVLEHGDFAHPNLLVLTGERLGALDWEEGQSKGLPLHDLIFFLGYVAFSLYDPRRPADHVDAFVRLLSTPETTALRALQIHADRRGIDRGAIAPLILACWARYATGLAARLVDDAAGAGAASVDAVAGWLSENRYYLLWRHALDHQERLQRLACSGARR
jgi:hypothetical protein